MSTTDGTHRQRTDSVSVRNATSKGRGTIYKARHKMVVYNITNHYHRSSRSASGRDPKTSSHTPVAHSSEEILDQRTRSESTDSEPASNRTKRHQSRKSHPQQDTAVNPWYLQGAYVPKKLYNDKPAALVAIKDGNETQLAIQVSRDLARTIEGAIENSRVYRNTSSRRQQELILAKSDEYDNAQSLAGIRSRLDELRKKGILDDNDQAVLVNLTSQHRRAFEKRGKIRESLAKLQDRESRIELEFKGRWFDVEKLLAKVWTDARIPLRRLQQPVPGGSSRNSSQWSQDYRQERREERLERRNDRPSAPRAETKTPFDKGKLVDPHSEVLSAIARLSRRHKDLLRARDRCENYCHNYDREGARYLKAVQNSNGSRSSNSIREEFNKGFLRDVILDKKSLQAARTDYLAAHEEARKLGIPKNCIDFVESIDLQSCDTGIIMEKDAVNRRATGDDQHKLDSRIRAWRTLTTTDPLPQQVVVEDSPDRSSSASSAGRTENSIETDASRDLSRDAVVKGDVGKLTRATRERLQGQRSDARTASSVVRGIDTGVNADKELKSGSGPNPESRARENDGPEVNLWKPSDGIKFSRTPDKVPDANDNKETVKPNPPVRVSPRGGKKSIAYFFKARPKSSKPVVGPGKAADISSAGKAMSGEKRKSSSEGSPSSNKRRRSERPTAPD